MAVALTIAGATKKLRKRTLNLARTANGRATLSLSVVSTDASYRPALDADVILTDGSTRIFGGLLQRTLEKSLTQNGAAVGIETQISAADYNVYTERRYVNETLSAGTLKSMLTTLVNNYLDDYGVSLHASQVNGPTLPELTYGYVKLSDVLNDLASLTASSGEPYVWAIDNFKVLRMYQPSTSSAPFNIANNTPADVMGDLTVETMRESGKYANRVIVRVPTVTQSDRQESFVGDGSTTTVSLQYTVMSHYGHILVASGGGELVGTAADATQWTLDQSVTPNTLTRNVGPLANGETYTFQFTGFFTGSGFAEDAGEIASVGVWEMVVQVDSVPDNDTADAIAEGILARAIIPTEIIRYNTRTADVAPGQSQSVTMSRRNLSGLTAVFSDIRTRELGDAGSLQHEVTAVIDDAQTNLGRGWRDKYRLWADNGRPLGASASASSNNPPVSVVTESDQYVFKTSDTTSPGTNSATDTTLANDPHLFFTVDANARYWWELVVIYTAQSTVPDIKVGLSGPSGFASQWANESGTAGSPWSETGLAGSPTALSNASGTRAAATTNTGSNPYGLIYKGTVVTGGTAGTFHIQWAQNSQSVDTVTWKTGSFIRYRKIA